MESTIPLPIARPAFSRKRHVLPNGSAFLGRTEAKSEARLPSLAGEWFTCRTRSSSRAIWIEAAAQGIRGGMSGSPIVAPDGTAIGIVSVSAITVPVGAVLEESALDDGRDGGPNPLLCAHLRAGQSRQRAQARIEPASLRRSTSDGRS